RWREAAPPSCRGRRAGGREDDAGVEVTYALEGRGELRLVDVNDPGGVGSVGEAKTGVERLLRQIDEFIRLLRTERDEGIRAVQRTGLRVVEPEGTTGVVQRRLEDLESAVAGFEGLAGVHDEGARQRDLILAADLRQRRHVRDDLCLRKDLENAAEVAGVV